MWMKIIRMNGFLCEGTISKCQHAVGGIFMSKRDTYRYHYPDGYVGIIFGQAAQEIGPKPILCKAKIEYKGGFATMKEIVGEWDNAKELAASLIVMGHLAQAVQASGKLPDQPLIRQFLRIGELTRGIVEDSLDPSIPDNQQVDLLKMQVWLEDMDGNRIDYPVRLVSDTLITYKA